MKIKFTKFKGLKVVYSPIHKDRRGHFREIFKKKNFLKKNFLFTCVSSSKKTYFEDYIFKKIFSRKTSYGIKGEIFDVALDLRKKSKTFGKYFSIKLSDTNGYSIYIPPGFAHGFVGLKKENIICYHCTNYRSKKNEIGLKWNDEDLNIKWPVKKPIISAKDKKNIKIKDYLNLT